MTICYLGLGSNLNSPERQLRKAIEALGSLPSSTIIKVASLYRNKAWGRKAQPQFCNTVIAIKTKLSPQRLHRFCQQLEQKQGRIRHLRWGARTLDIDILIYGSQRINSPTLTIPHPRIGERDFVLIPLLEIAHEINVHLPPP